MGPSPKLAAALACAAFAVLAAACGPPVEQALEPPEPAPAVAARHPDTLMAQQVKDLHVTRVEEMLRGRWPGVEVYSLPNGGLSVRIRGIGSVNGSGEPLFVVDGVQVHAEPGGALAWLDPHDIARIEVLKDPASLAFYGIRGGNGVVLITTKH